MLFNITARDADDPGEPGGIVRYSILSGDSSQRFSLDPVSGQLSVNAELNYDRQQVFILQVRLLLDLSLNSDMIRLLQQQELK